MAQSPTVDAGTAEARTAGSRSADIREQLQPLVDIARRVPFTATVAVVIVVAGLATQAFWRALIETDLWSWIAYGVQPLDAGRWWTPFVGSFFAQQPSQYLAVLGAFIVCVGFCEWRLGTRTAVISSVVGQLAGVFGACALLAALSRTGWAWAVTTSRELDGGFTPGAVCALVVVACSLRAPWRARVLVAVAGYCLIGLVWVGFFWDVAHFIALLVGIALGWRRARSMVSGRRQLSRHEVRVIAAAFLIIIAFAQVSAMVYPDNGPLGPEAHIIGRPLIILFVIAEVLVAVGLQRGSRLAWSAATALAITGAATSLALRPVARGVAAAVVFVPLVILLLRSQKAYTAPMIPLSRQRVLRDIAVVAIAFVAYVLLGFVLIDQYSPQPDTPMKLRELVARLFFASTREFQPASRPASIFLESLSLIPIVIVFGCLLVLLIRSRTPAAATNRDRTLELLHTYGGGNLSWMATWPDNAHFVTEDGKAAIAYQVKSNVAIALGDPMGAPESVAHSVHEFARFAEQHGWLPCFFSSKGAILSQADHLQWRYVQVAEDTVIDLPTLAFKGKAWQDVRTALNRAAKANITFRVVRLRDESFAMVQQAHGISDQWVSDKGMPEMGFTLGGIDEALDPEVRVGLAVDGDGVLQGITSWLPVYGPNREVRGWTLDVMRRLPDGFRPVMEFMIASACLTFKEQGAQTVSLSGAPLARSEEDDDVTPVENVLNQLGEMLEPVYGFRSLHQFKTKFKPRYEPMYLVYPDEAALPRVGVALTQAFLPGANLRQYASMLASARG